MKRLCQQRLSATQLAAAQKQLIGQIGVASDNNENNALGAAKTFLHYDRYDTLEELYRRIQNLTPGLLLEVANEVLAEDGLSELTYN